MRDLTAVKLTEVDRAIAHEVNVRGLINYVDFEALRTELLDVISSKNLSASSQYRGKFRMEVLKQKDLSGLLFYAANVMLRGDGLGVIKL